MHGPRLHMRAIVAIAAANKGMMVTHSRIHHSAEHPKHAAKNALKQCHSQNSMHGTGCIPYLHLPVFPSNKKHLYFSRLALNKLPTAHTKRLTHPLKVTSCLRIPVAPCCVRQHHVLLCHPCACTRPAACTLSATKRHTAFMVNKKTITSQHE